MGVSQGASATELDLATLWVMMARVARRFSASGASGDFTDTEMYVLAVVDNRGPLKVKDLVAQEGMCSTMVSRIIRRLHEAGLLNRTVDARDRRVARLEATPKGHEVHLARNAHMEAAFWDSMAELTPEHVAALVAATPALQVLAAGPDPETSATVPVLAKVADG